MKTLTYLFLGIDCLILLLCLYETFGVSSNRSLSSMVGVCLLLAVCIGVGFWLSNSTPKWALLAASLPFSIVILYFIIMLISGTMSNWR